MPNIHTFSDNALACNTYVYIESQYALIVDSSGQIDQIVQLLEKNKVSEVVLSYTHGHFDHIAYGGILQKSLQSANIIHKTLAPKLGKVYFSEQEGPLILNSSLKTFDLQNIYSHTKIPRIDIYLAEGESLGFLDFILIETPGHSPGSSCFYSTMHNIIFSGDTLFANGGRGRTDLPFSSEEELLQSLEKLSCYPFKTHIFPGHGPQDVLGESLQKVSRPS